MLLSLILVVLIGYLLGSLPFGYLVARARGVNIFAVGSCNPGATNVRRVLGPGPGNTVFALDALKGAGSASWALLGAAGAKVNLDLQFWGISAGGVLEGERWTQLGVAGLIAALLGHGFSCFTKFRGGKGVATSVGGLVILMPFAAVIAAAVWVAVFYSSRYVSLASILAALSLVIAAWLLSLPTLLLGLTVLIAAFVVIRHRSNIVRLLKGTENKSVKKGAAQKS